MPPDGADQAAAGGGSNALVPDNTSLQMASDLGTWLGNVSQLATQAENQGSQIAAMQAAVMAAAAGFLGPFVAQPTAAPTAVQKRAFAEMAWNVLRPVFQVMVPWSPLVVGSMQSSL